MAFKSSEYSSLDLLVDAYGSLVEANQDVATSITGSNKKVWKNKELRSLVDLYFDSTTKTLNLYITVKNCAKMAETSEGIIRYAVKQFETETSGRDLGGSKKKKYEKTLDELKKFKAVGDSFGEEFVRQYVSIYKQQVFLREELGKLKVKLGKKQKNRKKKLRMFSAAVFATALSPVIALSVLHAAPIIIATAVCSSSGLNATTGIITIYLGKKYKNAAKTQNNLLSETERSMSINHNATETIQIVVEQLRTSISKISNFAGIALERDDNELATKLAMRQIMKKVHEFTEKIEMVSKSVAEHTKLINVGREEVVHYLAKAKGNY